MEQLSIAKGLTVIGSRYTEDLTWLTLKWANYLAKTDKVLFLNWTYYTKKLNNFLEESDGKVEPNLTINTSFNKLEISTCIELFGYIKNQNFDIVFFDNIDAFRFDIHGDDNYSEKPVLDFMQFLINELSIKIIFNTSLHDNYLDYSKDYMTREAPVLKNFSRDMVNNCEHIYGFVRLFSLGIEQDETGKSTFDKLEIHNLKNPSDSSDVIKLDNRKYNIYKQENGGSYLPEEIEIVELVSNIRELVGKYLIFKGVVSNSRHKTTTNSRSYCVFDVNDDSGIFELCLFSENYQLYKKYLENGYFLEITIKIDRSPFTNSISYAVESITYA